MIDLLLSAGPILTAGMGLPQVWPVPVIGLMPVARSTQEQADDFVATVAPVLTENCTDCHGGDKPKAELDLSRFRTSNDAEAALDIFAHVRERIEDGEMPPAFIGPLPDDQRSAVLAWIDARIARKPKATTPKNRHAPEAVRMRRLNQAEYRYSVLDLFGIAAPVETWFPPDAYGHGFDTTAGTQTISPSFLEASLQAAERIAAQVIVDLEVYEPETVRIPSGQLETPGMAAKKDGLALLPARHRVIGRVTVQRRGTYRIHIVAGARRSQGVHTQVGLSIDNGGRERLEVTAERDQRERHSFEFELFPGHHTLGIYFEVDTKDWVASSTETQPDHELAVEEILVEGPLEAPPLPNFHRRLRADHPVPADAVRTLIRRAWRRPADEADVARLMSLTTEEASWEERVRTALIAILASPHFLLRIEALHGSDWGLASRLSYFLWSSTPDERLLSLAAMGLLRTSLHNEIERMLDDPRSSRLARRFAVQWLQLDRLSQHVPDPRRFPHVDAALLNSMREETQLFFESILRERRPVGELLASDYTFVDAALAEHYGIAGVNAPTGSFQRVPVPLELREQRGGILGHASVLTATSNPTRTSPVLRGKWIMDVLLGTPPPPPPPGVGDLADGRQAESEASLRERLERHREDPSCAVCHETMDGLGFGLENYDAVGNWRTEDGRFPLDARGQLPDGEPFSGPEPLRENLARDPGFHRALAQSLARYAVGRTLEADEVEELSVAVAALSEATGGQPHLAQIITLVCTSRAFRFDSSSDPGGVEVPGYSGDTR